MPVPYLRPWVSGLARPFRWPRRAWAVGQHGPFDTSASDHPDSTLLAAFSWRGCSLDNGGKSSNPHQKICRYFCCWWDVGKKSPFYWDGKLVVETLYLSYWFLPPPFSSFNSFDAVPWGSGHGFLSCIKQAMGIGFLLDWKWVFPIQSNFLSISSSSSSRQQSSSCEFITWFIISFVLLLLLIWFLNYCVDVDQLFWLYEYMGCSVFIRWIILCSIQKRKKQIQNFNGGFLLVLVKE